MEQKLPLIAKKAWSLMHAIFYMLKKGISKVKIMVDLNMMIKHGKIAGKSLHNHLFHHHHNWAATIFHRHPHHLSYPPPPPPADEYEFSCTTTPDHFPLSLLSTNKKHNEQVPHAVIKALKMLTYASPGFEKSPMVRQLRITDSPFPLSNDDEDGQVDADADEYIARKSSKKWRLAHFMFQKSGQTYADLKIRDERTCYAFAWAALAVHALSRNLAHSNEQVRDVKWDAKFCAQNMELQSLEYFVEMLLEKMKEIEAFNASRVSAKARNQGKGSASTQKEKRARWPEIKKVAENVKYPEKVHVITDYIIEGTNEETWNETWYVSSAYKFYMCPTRQLFKKLKYKFEMIKIEEIEKKFIFSYGVGDIIMEAREGNFCNLHYMFDEARTGKAQGESVTEDGLKDVVNEHNKFLDKKDVHYYVDEEYISWNGSLYSLKWIALVVIVITLGDKWKTVASIQGLTDDNDGEAIKGCYRKFIDMVQVYYETAKKTWFEKEPKGNVVGSSSGDARVKDPQGKDKDEAGKALEEDMNKKSKFGVSLEGNLEKEAEEGSVTDSNDLEVIV
ncbi:hypothetical protein Tco_0950768 [Tanacetum coccineum]